MKNVLEWLEKTTSRHPSKIAYMDTQEEISFSSLEKSARSIGSFLGRQIGKNEVVAVFCGRRAKTPAAFLGVVYAGGVYAPLDYHLPRERLLKILHQMKPAAILVDCETRETMESFLDLESVPIYIVEQIEKEEPDESLLERIRRNMVSIDPLYIIYTSGSTGMPKGVITSHDSLIRYMDAYGKVMGIGEDDRLGNQSPLDYIAAIRDIYLPLKTGCSTVIIPKEYFMQPCMLFEYMNEKKVTSVGWSVSALTIPVTLGAFEETKLTTLQKVCFSGSVMPAKCLRVWQENLPNAKYVNQYGPTEATASCTYYEIDHKIAEDEVIPIGKPYDNYNVFILKENGSLAAPGEEGEICVSGPCLALGYYKDPERTAASFQQNPVNTAYMERMYRTGDIGLEREDGILEFHGRKDRQIKHMGHRVELDEVEVAAYQVSGVKECCCLYQKEKEKLYLFYVGEVDKRTLLLELRKILPGFMVPRGVKCLDEMPKLSNGKTDMNQLKEKM